MDKVQLKRGMQFPLNKRVFMDFSEILLWVMVMGPLIFSPGPANIAAATISSQRGMRAAIVFTLGVSLINCFVLILMGLGMGVIYLKYRPFFQILEVLGALYIIYLGVKILRSKSVIEGDRPKILGFKEGVLLQLLNGKMYPVMIMMFSQFIGNEDAPFLRVFQVSALLLSATVLSYISWAFLGISLSRSKNPLVEGIQRYSFGTLLTFIGIWLIFH